MESAGIRVDPKMLLELSRDFAKRAADLEAEIHKLAGREFNVGSPKQLGEVMFDELSLPGGKKTKTGAYATGADILDDLAAQGHDLPSRVLDWRQLTKLRSTYTDSLQEQIDSSTGRVHTTYDMAGAATGATGIKRSQPAKHSGADRGRAQDPSRPSSPTKAASWYRLIIRRSSLESWPTSPTSSHSSRHLPMAPTFMR